MLFESSRWSVVMRRVMQRERGAAQLVQWYLVDFAVKASVAERMYELYALLVAGLWCLLTARRECWSVY